MSNDSRTRISAALDQLEAALNAAGSASGIGYEDAAALFHRCDLLLGRIEAEILCAAPDYDKYVPDNSAE